MPEPVCVKNHRPTDQQLEETVDNFLLGKIGPEDTEMLQRMMNDKESLVQLRDFYPFLRPENYDTFNDDNPRLVLLRTLLWAEGRLGRPSKLRRTPLSGFLARFWHDLILPCLEPLPIRPQSQDAIVAAYAYGAKAFAALDHRFDPWTGDTPALQVLRQHRRAVPEVDDKKRQTNLALTFQCVGHTLNMLQKHRHLPLRSEFRQAMESAAEEIAKAFELLRNELLRSHGQNLPDLTGLSTILDSPPLKANSRTTYVNSETEWDPLLRQWLEDLPDSEPCRDSALALIYGNQLSGISTDPDKQPGWLEYVDDADGYSVDERDLLEDIEFASVEESLDTAESICDTDENEGGQEIALGNRPIMNSEVDDVDLEELRMANLMLREGVDSSQADEFPESREFDAADQPETDETMSFVRDGGDNNSDDDSDDDSDAASNGDEKRVEDGDVYFYWGWDSVDADKTGDDAAAGHAQSIEGGDKARREEKEQEEEWVDDSDECNEYDDEQDDEGETDGDDDVRDSEISDDQIRSNNAQFTLTFREVDYTSSHPQATSPPNPQEAQHKPRSYNPLLRMSHYKPHSTDPYFITTNVMNGSKAGTLEKQQWAKKGDGYHDFMASPEPRRPAMPSNLGGDKAKDIAAREDEVDSFGKSTSGRVTGGEEITSLARSEPHRKTGPPTVEKQKRTSDTFGTFKPSPKRFKRADALTGRSALTLPRVEVQMVEDDDGDTEVRSDKIDSPAKNVSDETSGHHEPSGITKQKRGLDTSDTPDLSSKRFKPASGSSTAPPQLEGGEGDFQRSEWEQQRQRKSDLRRGPLKHRADEHVVRVKCGRCEVEWEDEKPTFQISDGKYLRKQRKCTSCGERATHDPVDGRPSIHINKLK